jgi:ABC-type Fe3+/spermidine/putrescine transport system ATPase subunit
MGAEGGLEVRGLSVDLGAFALRGVDLACAAGEYRVLLGPTGSGKSTFARCLLGLHLGARGSARLAGRDLTGLPPERRRMGWVPQGAPLFPHLDVLGNLRLGLAAGRADPHAGRARFARVAALLDLGPLLARDVRRLSGGERQQVALARALLTGPDLLVLDEPFSALDAGRRRRLWRDLREYARAEGTTVLHVTHSLEEACAMGDRLSVLLDGRLVQTGAPREVLERPASPAVAGFLGYTNLLAARVGPRPGGAVLDLGGIALGLTRALPEGEALVCLRPQDLRVLRAGEPLAPPLAEGAIEGRVLRVWHLAERCAAWVRVRDEPVLDLEIHLPAALPERLGLAAGARVRLGVVEAGVIAWVGPGTRSPGDTPAVAERGAAPLDPDPGDRSGGR